MTSKIELIQLQFQKRNARKRGPTSSDQINDTNDELAIDLATINSQWNNTLVPLVSALPNGVPSSTVDAFLNGIDGANLYVNQNATGSVNSTYFNAPTARPNTVFEQLDLVYSLIETTRSDLENQINNTVLTAAQISIADAAGLYAAANVENALAEVRTVANTALTASIVLDTSLIPTLDDTFDIGSASLRWKDLYLGPASLHVVATAAQGGGSSKNYSIQVDSVTGNLKFLEGSTDLFEIRADGRTQVDSLFIKEGPNPTAIAGYGRLYVNSIDNKLYFIDTNGDSVALTVGNSTANTVDLHADINADEANSAINFGVDGLNRWQIGNDGHFTAQGLYVIRSASGTLGNPAYSFTTSPTTGFFNSSPDEIQVVTSGTARVTFDNSGNVGFGTTNPSAVIDIVSPSMVGTDVETDTSDKTFRYTSRHYTNAEEALLCMMGYSIAGQNIVYIGGGTTLANAATDIEFRTAANTTTINGTKRMEITESGLVGIGALTPDLGTGLHIKASDSGTPTISSVADNLVIEKSTDAGISILTGSGGFGSIYFGHSGNNQSGRIRYSQTNDEFIFATNNANVMILDSSGDMIIDAMQQYMHIERTVVAGTSPTGIHNIFSTDDTTGTIANEVSNGITIDTATGIVTIANAGVYKITVVAQMIQSATGTLTTFGINFSVATDYAAITNVNNIADPVERTMNVVRVLAASETLEVEADSNSTSTLTHQVGSSLTITRIA